MDDTTEFGKLEQPEKVQGRFALPTQNNHIHMGTSHSIWANSWCVMPGKSKSGESMGEMEIN